MAEIQKIVTSAGWLDQCPGGPPSFNFERIEPEKLPPSQWDATVQEQRQHVLSERNKALPAQSGKRAGKDPNQNDVQIVDRSYLQKDFKAQLDNAQKLIEDVIQIFSLNSEQERSFRIVANHAVTPGAEQLIMYLGGMGGTGKSQVIKALMHFFKSRNESHRFVCFGTHRNCSCSSTGFNLSLIFGLPIDGQEAVRNKTTNNAQVRTRLDGVEYIFLDEVSMVHVMILQDQLSTCKGNEFGMPYGGINMIFVGDFAQLPPAFGSSLYSGSVGTQLISCMTVQGQQAAIGKALWHQVTTGVILREKYETENTDSRRCQITYCS